MDDSPEREIHEKEDKEYWQLLEITQAAITYQAIYSDKKPCRTSSYKGNAWVGELMDEDANPIRCYQMFRMDRIIFNNLIHDLVTSYNLEGTRNIDVTEMLGIFLHILGHGIGNWLIQERFQRSGETVSRYFSLVLDKVCEMGKDLIQPVKDQIRFIGRKCTPTQNILAVCNFNMEFTYFWAGWEGQAHDTRIFYEALGRCDVQFPHPPPGLLINGFCTLICINVVYVD